MKKYNGCKPLLKRSLLYCRTQGMSIIVKEDFYTTINVRLKFEPHDNQIHYKSKSNVLLRGIGYMFQLYHSQCLLSKMLTETQNWDWSHKFFLPSTNLHVKFNQHCLIIEYVLQIYLLGTLLYTCALVSYQVDASLLNVSSCFPDSNKVCLFLSISESYLTWYFS